MTRRVALVAALAALALPAAAFAGDTFVVVPDAAQPAAPTLPSALAPNAPGAIAVDESFTVRPLWVEQPPVDQLQQIWEQAGSAYGVPWQVLAAINKVESDFGANMGPSSAGAVGWMQFMPDTWLRWGVDANGDGVADPWNAEDAIYSAARYLAASGAGSDIQRAVFSYNHADWYVSEVLSLASAYAGGTIPSGSFGFAPVPVDLTPLRDRVAAAREALTAARSAMERLAPVVDRAQAALDRTALLSDRLDAQKRLTIVGIRYDRARALARRLERQLAGAQGELDQARAAADAAPSPIFGGAPSLVAADAFGISPASFAGTAADGPEGVALRFALAELGAPYQWGAEGPFTFDCSGLVQAAYASAGVALPRVAQQQYDAGPLVLPGEPLQPGDLVFFGSDAAHVEHVGIVTGPGLMVDAPYTGAVVRFDSYLRASYVGATRPAVAARVLASAPTDGPVVDFSTAQADPPAAGEILFTKNP